MFQKEETKRIIEMAVLAALMHHKPDYRSPTKLTEAAKVITGFVVRELENNLSVIV